MPELPEVETIVRDVAPRIAGRQIVEARLSKTDVLRQVSTRRLLATLTGNTITGVARRAKHVVITLASGERLIIQPRMTGSLVAYDRPLSPAETKYAVLVCRLEDGGWLVYRDIRRLGTISLLSPTAWLAYSARIGPEPLERRFTGAVFASRLRGSRAAIKKALMDQRRIAGIGNIYANEALFAAGLDPSRAASSIAAAEYSRLYVSVREVLRRAVRAKGSTVRDYRTGTGATGRFQLELKVYGRGGEACVRCGRRLVTTHAIDLRATTLCPHCQR
ncbi:MAG TPA: bifunctional DNA-formamidopyrimidine glycosylase/DNA-(apurinic or apyrimidinic site) lyase [Gemmatimonadales bacterium]|nr:bifunctional DNA-formamidopyrimidine glycosylase/DNA-(apurinic or apyrimidinic site) lyase [Gemmatimonadales bacterium]